MKQTLLMISLLAPLLGGCAMSYAAKLSAEFSAQNTLVAFVGVHVVPMDTERMLTDRREMLVSMTVAVA